MRHTPHASPCPCCAVYPDGKVCISILHPPGEDKFNEMVRTVAALGHSGSVSPCQRLSPPVRACLPLVVGHAQESADERWRPILGVEAILISVMSLFADPNDDSPANIDAAVRMCAVEPPQCYTS